MKRLLFIAITVVIAVWNALSSADIPELGQTGKIGVSILAGVLVIIGKMIHSRRASSADQPIADRRYCHLYPAGKPNQIVAKRCKGVLHPDGRWDVTTPKGFVQARKYDVELAEKIVKELTETIADEIGKKFDHQAKIVERLERVAAANAGDPYKAYFRQQTAEKV